MESNYRLSILWFGQRWDKYRRRDIELISRLIRFPNIEHIILVEPPLPLTSISNLWRRNYDEDGKDTWKRILQHGLIWQPEPNIWVITPLVPVIGNRKYISRINTSCKQFFAKKVIRRFNVRQLVLWFGYPYNSSQLIGQFGEDLICYSLNEDFQQKDPLNSDVISNEDSRLSKEADFIIVVSEQLALNHQEYRDKVHVVPNGVDIVWINNYKKRMSLNSDIKAIKKPVIGFVGGIDDSVDLNLVKYLALERPDWSVVMIGAVSKNLRAKIQRASSMENLYFLGSKPFELIPAYIDNFDVCILPFKDNVRNRNRSAMKLYVYLALGKPIVSRPIADAEKFSCNILLAHEKVEFLRAIEKALTGDSVKARQARISMAETQSWEKRAEDIYGLMVEALVKKKI